ncbi:MAG: diguanylate cyclase [Candidatus Omnitrophota bacterium]
MDKTRKILIFSADKDLINVLSFCFQGWNYTVLYKDFDPSGDVPADIAFVKKISPDVIILDLQSANKHQLSICHFLKKDFTTAFIPVITLINKGYLRGQLLNIKEGVDDYLIKPPDPLDLHVRVEMALRRSQFSFNANSLTGLPGARVLEEMVKQRLEKGVNFSFAYVDIDNFKYYNDIYGYHKGDCVIIQTAHILYNSIKEIGNSEDLLIHIGGDDFAFITSHNKLREICQSFVCAFEKLIPFHYSSHDRTQGFVVARDRTHEMKNVSLMSVSVAAINKYAQDGIHNIIQINERIAEIKRYLKEIPGSKFMVDRRNNKLSTQSPQLYENNDITLHSYKPLGQILLERNIVMTEQLYEALKLHWKRGNKLGEILIEMGYLNQQQLDEALEMQKNL